MKINLKTYADFRRVFIKQERITEEEFRQGFYNANKTIQRPCPKIENFVRRIYHPTAEELTSEGSDLS